MIDHVSMRIRSLGESRACYDRVLQPLGMTRMVGRLHTIGFRKKYTESWLNAFPPKRAMLLRGSDEAEA